jgi:hypothetical protein
MMVHKETPPQRRNKQKARGYWDLTAQQLRDDPGEWYLIAENESTTFAYRIPKGVVAAFRPVGAFEVQVQTFEDPAYSQPRGKVWARYVGEPDG